MPDVLRTRMSRFQLDRMFPDKMRSGHVRHARGLVPGARLLQRRTISGSVLRGAYYSEPMQTTNPAPVCDDELDQPIPYRLSPLALAALQNGVAFEDVEAFVQAGQSYNRACNLEAVLADLRKGSR